MTAFFSTEPLTRGERAACMVVQVFSFGVCAYGIDVGCRHPGAPLVTFGGAALMFVFGVVLRVRRQLAPKVREDFDESWRT